MNETFVYPNLINWNLLYYLYNDDANPYFHSLANRCLEVEAKVGIC